MIYLEKKRTHLNEVCVHWEDLLPEIGLRFIALARSLVASCHSLVNVLGGGAATTNTQRKKEDWMSKLKFFFFFKFKTNDLPKCCAMKYKTPPKPTRPVVARKILRPSPGALVGARGP